jgi:phage baseplate assembly protein W
MDIAFPYQITGQGTTAAAASADDHIAQMLEQLLFTRPGERVHHPDFGCGLLDLVFSPNSPEVAAALSITVSAAVQKWLGDLVKIGPVDVTAAGSEMRAVVSYTVVASGAQAMLSLPVPVG